MKIYTIMDEGMEEDSRFVFAGTGDDHLADKGTVVWDIAEFRAAPDSGETIPERNPDTGEPDLLLSPDVMVFVDAWDIL
ncbi:hypothetical protein [uncultured Ruegeria sp.]|uniref:hypothetical protein n=1 Tax=uncultured Ruegeria sp. TaxID=259304 RepID=UPI00261ED488|nr:hypothetical protein [uncultured Ruegeria sp.]